jgi:hypothetical protein
LLCGACHDKKTRGIWSTEKIAAARRRPITFQRGRAHDAFDLAAPFTLWIGSTSFHDVRDIVRTQDGYSWLSVAPGESPGGPIQLSAIFFDANNTPSLRIEGNMWEVLTSTWDVEAEGRTIVVRSRAREVVLQLTAAPPHSLRLERLNMQTTDLGVTVDATGRVTIRHGAGQVVFEDCGFSAAETVLSL